MRNVPIGSVAHFLFYQPQSMLQPQIKGPRFAIGDAVIHKDQPNSPLMTVRKIERYEDAIMKTSHISGISCYWFDEKGAYYCESFHSRSLRHVTSEEVSHLKAKAVA